jgi:predicted GTPase
MARFKGILDTTVSGIRAIEKLKDGDTILISEGCTHHRQCEDIGTVKLPKWFKNYTQKELSFEYTSGMGFPEDLSKYSMVVHCGGCMLNEREVKYRMKSAVDQNIPFTNYGIAIAYMNGILDRSIEIFNK